MRTPTPSAATRHGREVRTILARSILLCPVVLGLLAAPVAASITVPSVVPPRPTGAFGEYVVQQYVAPARDLPTTIRFIINFVLGIVGIIALAVLLSSLFSYVTAGGEEAGEAARATITNAIIGLIVIGIAAAVVNFFIGAVLTPTVALQGTLPSP